MPAPGQDPTPYQDINTLLHELLSGVQTILGQQFVGMYLHGSLALGDFRPEGSDIDFLVAADGNLSEDYVRALHDMHERLVALDARWGHELEGSYIPRQALRRYDPADAVHPHIERGGSLVVEHHQTDSVIQRHVARERGITLAGPPPHTLIDPIPADDLRRALVGLMRSWWGSMRHDPFRLRHRGYQAYAALTMCRILYTMRHGIIVSKPTAGRWGVLLVCFLFLIVSIHSYSHFTLNNYLSFNFIHYPFDF
jgi:predicted nucleotidyltransferase